ncbi:MAG UNVERIFIED_CONTAM: hypothetical protein LVR18_15800 [Planctomycetaceae bacterium]
MTLMPTLTSLPQSATLTAEDANDSGDTIGDGTNALRTSVDSLTVTTSAGSTAGAQFLLEDNGLTAVNLNAGTAAITLTLTRGSLFDTDADTDITAGRLLITLLDVDDAGDDVGTQSNAIQTSVSDLTVITDAGSVHGDQYLLEVNGLTQLALNAGTANVTLTVSDGNLEDSDTNVDVLATSATIQLNGTSTTVGTAANVLQTSVTSLSVQNSGDQFLVEQDGLANINLNATTGNIELTLLDGSLQDGDTDTDVTGNSARIILADANDSGDAVGTATNPLQTSVNSLTVFTDADSNDGAQFLEELNGLTALEVNAGSALIRLTLLQGNLEDADTDDDIITTGITLTLNSSGSFAGTSGNLINTNVDSLTVTTNNGSQFFRERSGIDAVNMIAGSGAITLVLTEGALSDVDGDIDFTGGAATIVLEDANDSGDDVGSTNNAIRTSVDSLTVTTSAGSTYGNQYLLEDDGLTQLNLNAATASITLTLSNGSLLDGDADIDATAGFLLITLEDSDDSGDDAGTLESPIQTSVDELTVQTGAGSVFGNQFFREASGLTRINLDSKGGLINLKLTEGSLQDSDGENDVIATTAVITLEDANDNGDDVGTLTNPIHTSVDSLSVFTSAGLFFGNQFFREANGLTQANLDSGAALINLKLTDGALQDIDAANDFIGTTAVITLEDAERLRR